jgi:hypothetical protein
MKGIGIKTVYTSFLSKEIKTNLNIQHFHPFFRYGFIDHLSQPSYTKAEAQISGSLGIAVVGPQI